MYDPDLTDTQYISLWTPDRAFDELVRGMLSALEYLRAAHAGRSAVSWRFYAREVFQLQAALASGYGVSCTLPAELLVSPAA